MVLERPHWFKDLTSYLPVVHIQAMAPSYLLSRTSLLLCFLFVIDILISLQLPSNGFNFFLISTISVLTTWYQVPVALTETSALWLKRHSSIRHRRDQDQVVTSHSLESEPLLICKTTLWLFFFLVTHSLLLLDLAITVAATAQELIVSSFKLSDDCLRVELSRHWPRLSGCLACPSCLSRG